MNSATTSTKCMESLKKKGRKDKKIMVSFNLRKQISIKNRTRTSTPQI